MAHTRFFNYSDHAPNEYKQKLERAVANYDRVTDALTYTPDVSLAILAIMSGTLTFLNSEDHQFIIMAIQIALTIIAALSLFIKRVCTSMASSTRKDSEKLIRLGVNNGFFNTNPDFSDMGLDEKRQILHDAQMHCVLNNPKRELITEKTHFELSPV